MTVVTQFQPETLFQQAVEHVPTTPFFPFPSPLQAGWDRRGSVCGGRRRRWRRRGRNQEGILPFFFFLPSHFKQTRARDQKGNDRDRHVGRAGNKGCFLLPSTMPALPTLLDLGWEVMGVGHLCVNCDGGETGTVWDRDRTVVRQCEPLVLVLLSCCLCLPGPCVSLLLLPLPPWLRAWHEHFLGWRQTTPPPSPACQTGGWVVWIPTLPPSQ